MVLVVLAGCASGLPSGRPTSESPPLRVVSPVITPRSAPAPQEAPVAAHPEERLERVTLADALARSERLHPELAVGQAQIERAEGLALQAGLFPNPELVARLESAPLTRQFAEQAEY